MISKLLKRFQVRHNFSTPYHPQTNGLVERYNRTLCESLAKIAHDTDEWDLYIAPALFAYRTSKQSTTRIEPFFLVYGRSAKLPIDCTSDAVQPSETLPNYVGKLVNDLPHIREKVQVNINRAQGKQKEYHNRNLSRNISYQIGDKVLYYKAAQAKQWSGKLDPKWKGPYYIHQVLLNGSYKLRDVEENVLRTPVNGSLLKVYHDHLEWEPMITIE